MTKIEYNPDVKILSIRMTNKKSVDSDIQNNVVLDYDEDGNLVNIDILEIELEDVLASAQERKGLQKEKTR